MGYTKKWIPPGIPYRDNLAAWKQVFGDLHQSILDAGLVQTSTAGQLDIQSVSVLPADGAFAGFIEYAFNDGLQATAPVVIKIEYGCGIEGLADVGSNLRRTRTLRTRSTVSIAGNSGYSYQAPQAYNNSGTGTTQLTSEGFSTIVYSPERGFFGIVYGAGSANKPFQYAEGGYYGSRLSLFVQRSIDEDGTPNGGGVMVYGPNVSGSQPSDSFWASGILQVSLASYTPVSGATITSTLAAQRIGGNSYAVIGGEVQMQEIFALTPKPVAFPYIVSYAAEVSSPSIPQWTEFGLEVFPGTTANFVALGIETSLSIDPYVGHRAGVAMLFE